MPVARLPTGTYLQLPIVVVHGAHAGPAMWVNAAIHGDELNGIDIIRNVLDRTDARRLHGTLMAVPIVNVFGIANQSRYLPDRRDLNRSFPGSKSGSLAAQLAHLFMSEVVERCSHGIDLHTGSNHRTNLPQVRADLRDAETLRCARAFAPPALVQGSQRSGSLREAATRRGRVVLLYEAGEPNRFNEDAIQRGTAGVLRVMKLVGMRSDAPPKPKEKPTRIDASRWIRAPRSGIFHLDVSLGQRVRSRQHVGRVYDPLGEHVSEVRAAASGVVIGHTNNPIVSRGDALVHVATPIA